MIPMDRPKAGQKFSAQQTSPDTCARCGGLLLTQHYMDLLDDTGQIDITAWHCMTCGEVIDPVILKNRRTPPPNLLYGPKARKFSQRVTGASDEKTANDGVGGLPSDETEDAASDESNR
jgi:hypothetical protein